MEPPRESTDGSNTSPASTLLSSYSQVFLVFFLQVQIPCYILSSCATSQVRRAVSLSVVPVQHCCLEEDPSSNHLVSLGCSFCGGLFVAHSSWSLERENARNYETKTSSSYFDGRMISMQPCSWTNIRARRSTSARSETAPHSTVTQIFPNPHYLFNYESVSCRKVTDTF